MKEVLRKQRRVWWQLEWDRRMWESRVIAEYCYKQLATINQPTPTIIITISPENCFHCNLSSDLSSEQCLRLSLLSCWLAFNIVRREYLLIWDYCSAMTGWEIYQELWTATDSFPRKALERKLSAKYFIETCGTLLINGKIAARVRVAAQWIIRNPADSFQMYQLSSDR